MKNYILAITSLLLACTIKAQTDEMKWNIGLSGGLIQYQGDRGRSFYSTHQAAYGFGEISFSRYLSRHFDISFFATRGEVGNVQPLSSWSTGKDFAERHFLTRFSTANVVLKYNLTKPEAAVRPYIFAGGGLMMYDKRFTETKMTYGYSLPTGGVGIGFRISPILSLRLQETVMYTNRDDVDHTVRKNPSLFNYNDAFLFHTATLAFNLGKIPDADNDRVSDKKDMCPNTPMGVAVDAKGCPVDIDKDGVADYLDQCPDVAGVAGLSGCPDKDNDGVADKDDRCPDMAGSVSTRGCPDSDNDGIIDIDDHCPGTKSGYKVDASGCPFDNDKDGIVNDEDQCPDVAGIAALHGCPDADGDGVADMDDKCPDVKGTMENKGCPELPKATTEKITLIGTKIFFETGSDKLKSSSQNQLDDLVDILNKYPAAHLTIEGYTDDVGTDEANMALSQKRADSVKNYLMSKGISESRLTSVGFGKTKPVDTSKTSKARSKNRRVELKTSF